MRLTKGRFLGAALQRVSQIGHKPPIEDVRANDCFSATSHWGSEPPTAAMCRLAVVGADVGSHDRLALQAKAACDRGCVKTSLEKCIERIDRPESRVRDDRRPAKGLRYPIFGVARKFLEFSHGLDPLLTLARQDSLPQTSRWTSAICGRPSSLCTTGERRSNRQPERIKNHFQGAPLLYEA